MCRILVTVILSLCATIASAQTSTSSNLWSRGSQLGVLAGGASSSESSGPMLAGSVGWEVTRWVTIEGRGSWFDRGDRAAAFSADLGATANVVPRRKITPFVGAGYGLYRASFERGATGMPDFYRDRMTGERGNDRLIFTDPSLRLTAGVDVITRRHWSFRPELATVIVRSGGSGETLLVAGMRVGYRFEDHPVTPEH